MDTGPVSFDARFVIMPTGQPHKLLAHQLWRHRDCVRNGTVAIALHACKFPTSALKKQRCADVAAMIRAHDASLLTDRFSWVLQPTYIVKSAVPGPATPAPEPTPRKIIRLQSTCIDDFAVNDATRAVLFPLLQ